MKYVILHGEGLTNQPFPELDGKTPLQVAKTPNLDRVASRGELGLLSLADGHALGVPEMISLGLLGYDQKKYPTGPAAFEAAGLGVVLDQQDVAFRCSMVTLRAQGAKGSSKSGGTSYSDIKKFGPHVILENDTAGDITHYEARELIDAVNEQLGSETIQFYPGTGHRHLMVWVGGKAKSVCVDPHDILGQPILEFLPKGDGSDILRKLMEASLFILESHEVNEQRLNQGDLPANCLWLWGPGRNPKLPKMPDRFNLSGTVVAMNDLVRGVGVSAGLDAISPDDLSEEGEPTYRSLSERGLQALRKGDILYLHVKVRPEGHELDPHICCERVEAFDRDVVGVYLEELEKLGGYRLLVAGGSGSNGGTQNISNIYGLIQGPTPHSKGTERQFFESEAAGRQANMRDASKLATWFLSRG